jgi:O-antigen/teichoic acid export membrane protein
MTVASAPSRQPAPEPPQPAHGIHPSPMASVARGALLLLSAQPITWAASALSVIVTPRYLGAEALGVFVFCWTIAGIAGTVVTLGVPEFLVRRVAHRPALLRAEGGGALVLLFVAAVLTASAIALIMPLLGFPLARMPILALALCGMVGTVVQSLLVSLLRAQERHARFAWLNAGGVVASNVASVAVLALGGGIEAYSATIAAALIATTLVTWRATGLGVGGSALAPHLFAPLLRGGLPFLGWNLALRLRMEMDRLLLGLLASVATIGWYAAAYRIIAVTVFVPTLITTPLLPALSRHADDRALFDQTLRRSLIAALALTTPICAMIVGLAPAIPETLGWPASFSRSVPLMMILALQMPVIAVDMVMGTGLIALHRERPWLVVAVIGATFNAVANVLLITAFERSIGNGAIGAALTTVVTEFVMLIGAIVLLPRGTIGRSVVFTCLRILLAGVCLAAVAMLLLPVSLFLAAGAAGCAFVAAMVALRVVRPEDLRRGREQVISTFARRAAA